MKKIADRDLASFLQTGKTTSQIAKHLSVPETDVKKLLVGLEKEYNVFPSVNDRDTPIFLAREKPVKKTVAERVWTYTTAKGRFGRPQPYITVRLPDDVKWNKVKIYPFGDLHFGAKGFHWEVFNAMMKLVQEKEYGFVVFTGDLIENALGKSIGGAVFEQEIPPHEQILQIREMLRPIAHKAFLSLPGNHEWRSFKEAGLDPLEFGFCEHLGIPYFSEPVHLDVLWHGKVFSFYVRHGKGNAQTTGGQMNIAAKPLLANEHMDFTLMGHLHNPLSDTNTKLCREFVYDEDDEDEIVDMRTIERTEHVAIASAAYHHFGTYGSRGEFLPNATELIHACVLEPSGKSYLEKKPLILEP